MKKVVLVMVWILFIAVFVALNYLLWDKENREMEIRKLESSNASNDASITALGREINILEAEKKKLEEKFSELEESNRELQDAKHKLEQDKLIGYMMVTQKDDVINKLKQQVDIKILGEPVKKWVEAIDTGDYKTAYELLNKKTADQSSVISLTDFTNNYKDHIKNIKIKNIKLYIDESSDEGKGEIILTVSLDIKLAEGVSDSFTQLVEGENEKYFTIGFDREKNDWFITRISAVP